MIVDGWFLLFHWEEEEEEEEVEEEEEEEEEEVLISASVVALRSHWYKSLELCQKGLSESYLLPPLILCVSVSNSF
jgi:hypothetical protein